MSKLQRAWVGAAAVVITIAAGDGRAQSRPADDVADVPAKECRAGGDENKRYMLIGPNTAVAAPAEGYSLLLVLPGGDGSESFQPFVKRVFKYALPEGYLVAELVAHKWTAGQKIVWPSAKDKVADAKFRTEEFVDAVVAEVRKMNKINSKRIFVLAWSSGGPAAYAVSLQAEKPVSGSLIAMSVFVPLMLPALDRAKGHAYYLLHSPDDQVCVFDFAKQALQYLSAQGAAVKLTTYSGGHGWHGDVFGEIRNGIEWLETNAGKSAEEIEAANGGGQGQKAETRRAADGDSPKNEVKRAVNEPAAQLGREASASNGKPPTATGKPGADRRAGATTNGGGTTFGTSQPIVAKQKPTPDKNGGGEKPGQPVLPPGTNLLLNGGFENGTAGWMILNNSGRATIESDRQTKQEGSRGLKVSKKGGPPIDVVRQTITDLPKSKKLAVSAQIKSLDAKNAFLKFFIYDANENPLREDVDMEHITGSTDWKKVSRTYELPPNAESAAVMLVMVLDGTVWMDDVQVTAAD